MRKENTANFSTLVMASMERYKRTGSREGKSRQVEGKPVRAVLEKPKKDGLIVIRCHRGVLKGMALVISGMVSLRRTEGRG